MRPVIKFQTQHLFMISGILFGSSSSVTSLCTWLFCYSQKQVKSRERFSLAIPAEKDTNSIAVFSQYLVFSKVPATVQSCVFAGIFLVQSFWEPFSEAYNAALKLVSKSHFEKKQAIGWVFLCCAMACSSQKSTLSPTWILILVSLWSSKSSSTQQCLSPFISNFFITFISTLPVTNSATDFLLLFPHFRLFHGFILLG